jgi:hypothetical protein
MTSIFLDSTHRENVSGILFKNRKAFLKFIGKHNKFRIDKAILIKKNKPGGITLLGSKIYYEVVITETSCFVVKADT